MNIIVNKCIIIQYILEITILWNNIKMVIFELINQTDISITNYDTIGVSIRFDFMTI